MKIYKIAADPGAEAQQLEAQRQSIQQTLASFSNLTQSMQEFTNKVPTIKGDFNTANNNIKISIKTMQDQINIITNVLTTFMNKFSANITEIESLSQKMVEVSSVSSSSRNQIGPMNVPSATPITPAPGPMTNF